METNCTQEAYQRYVEEASKYTTPLSFEQWCNQVSNRVFDLFSAC